MAHSLAKNSRYNKFVRARNKALEHFHLQSQLKISAAVHEMLMMVRDVVTVRYPQILRVNHTNQGKQQFLQLEFMIRRIVDMVIPSFIHEMTKLRRITYLLTYASEAEAIAQATGKPMKYTLDKMKIKDKETQSTFIDGTITSRVEYTTHKLARKIVSAIELSLVTDSPLEDALDRLDRAFPPIKTVSTEQRNLKVGPVLKESDGKEDLADMSSGYIDDETWDELVGVYKDEMVPNWRGPEQSYTVGAAGEKQELYVWELEQEITQDFVYQVRQGQIDAAKENGIEDYVWVAIVDSVTDDCCLWRDGLTTAEIERELKGKHADDRCDSIVPPAHFNCRCVLAPMVEEMPETPESNAKDFERWLET